MFFLLFIGTLVGSGKNELSSEPNTPAPNCTCNTPFEVNLVINLRGTFCTFKLLLIVEASTPVLVSSTNTVSCPKKGTSVQVLPSESVISKIPIIWSSSILKVENLSASLYTLVIVLTVPEVALTFLLNKYSAGLSPSKEWRVTSVGS